MAPRRRWGARSALVALGYCAAGQLSLTLAIHHGAVTPLWLPTGISMAALTTWGWEMLPAIGVGAVAVNLESVSPGAALVVTVGNVLAPALMVESLRRLGFDPRMRRIRDAVLIVSVGMVAMSVSAGIGTLTLLATMKGLSGGRTFLTWWSGDLVGALVLGPSLLCLPARQRWRADRGSAELAGLLALTVVTAELGFGSQTMRFLVFPVIVTAALRFHLRGAAWSMLVTSIVAARAAASGSGAFARESDLVTMFTLQAFTSVAALTAYLLAAMSSDRAAARRSLERRSERSEALALESITELRRSQHQLADAQAIAHIGSWDFDVESDTVLWSDELYRLTGIDPAEAVTSTSYASRIHPDEVGTVRGLIQARQATGGSWAVDHRLVRPDGTEIWVHCEGQALLEDGRLVHMMGTATDITARRQQEQQLEQLVLHDTLTGLPNRLLLSDRLSRSIRCLERQPGRCTAVLFLDLDRFKWVNDSLGHAAGDRVLCTVAERLSNGVRPQDTVARFGGDELVVVCEGLPDANTAVVIATALLDAVRSPIDLPDGHRFVPTVSVGVSTTTSADTEPESMLREADAAMYLAKEQGRDRVQVFVPSAHEALGSRLSMAVELRAAIEAGHISVHYQPVVNLRSGAVVGFEALARWHRPGHGEVPPEVFVDLAEETGQIEALDRHVILTAAQEFGQLTRELSEARSLGLAINVSLQHLSTARLRETLEEAIGTSGMVPRNICVEVTETAELGGEELAHLLRMVKSLGLRVAIDDFGTGFSALSRLRGLAVDTIKVDRSFVVSVHSSPRSRAIVAAMAQLARALDAHLVAEGVESAGQRDALEEVGCDDGQGHFWSAALPIAKVGPWLTGSTSRPSAPRLPAQRGIRL